MEDDSMDDTQDKRQIDHYRSLFELRKEIEEEKENQKFIGHGLYAVAISITYLADRITDMMAGFIVGDVPAEMDEPIVEVKGDNLKQEVQNEIKSMFSETGSVRSLDD
jgi:hypothetical protein